MDVIKLTRELGKAIQQDERYLNVTKCIEANEKDSALCDLMAKVQLIQLSYQKEAQNGANEEKMQEIEKEFNAVYAEIMQNENMQNYEKARAEIDDMMNYIVGILGLCVNGEDPETCEPPKHDCDCDHDHDHDCDCGCHDCH